ncbi:MAG: hypothetical protein AAGA45_03250, partial [Verrucomicrobiota bacterium]
MPEEGSSTEPFPASRRGRDLPSQERIKRSKKNPKSSRSKRHSSGEIRGQDEDVSTTEASSSSLDADQRVRRKRQSKSWIWKTLLAIIILIAFTLPAVYLLLREEIDFAAASAELVNDIPKTSQAEQDLSAAGLLQAHASATGIEQLTSLSTEWSLEKAGVVSLVLEDRRLPDQLRRLVILDGGFEAICLLDGQLWLWGRQGGEEKNILRANNIRLQRFIELDLL